MPPPQSHSEDITSFFQQVQQSYWKLERKNVEPEVTFKFNSRTSTCSLGAIGTLRDEVNALDKRIRSQLLLVGAIHRALRDAENCYLSLKEEHKRLLNEIDELVQKNRKHNPIFLPTEIIIKICSYSKPNDFGSVYEVWGDIAYKSFTRTFYIFKLPTSQTVLQKCSDVQIEAYVGGDEITDRLRLTLEKPIPFGRWKKLFLSTSYRILPSSHENVLAIIRACGSYLSTVTFLRVGITANSFDYPRRSGEEHDCDGCLQGIIAPSCTRLSLPLRFLPCFRDVNAGQVLRLDVDLRDVLKFEFTSYFEGFDLRNLRTLSLRWDSYSRLPNATAKLIAPNLQEIFTFIKDTISSGDVFSNMLSCIECPGLEALEIYDFFEDPTRRRRTLITEIGTLFKTLKRLEIHYRTKATNAQFQVLSGVLGDLQTRGEDPMLLPQLTHLTIPHPWSDFDKLGAGIIEMLESRGSVGTPVHTIELLIEDDIILSPVQQLRIDQLGLFVKQLLVTRHDGHWRFDD